MNARATLLTSLLLAASCARDEGPEEAMQAFAAFQHALQQRDVDGCRDLLTRESRPVVDELPWDAIGARAPLEVVGAARTRGNAAEFYVDVLDPNEADAPGRYVVVREYGRMVVDLVASAGLTARAVEASSGDEKFEPAPLTPADFDRIRAYELSQPPAKPGGN
jgi:hypothetical protein